MSDRPKPYQSLTVGRAYPANQTRSFIGPPPCADENYTRRIVTCKECVHARSFEGIEARYICKHRSRPVEATGFCEQGKARL